MRTVFFNTRQLVVKFQCDNERRVVQVYSNPTDRNPYRLLFKLIHFFRDLKSENSEPIVYPASEITVESIQHTLNTNISLEHINLISPMIARLLEHGVIQENNSFETTTRQWIGACFKSITKLCGEGKYFKVRLLTDLYPDVTMLGKETVTDTYIGSSCVTNGSYLVHDDKTYISVWASKPVRDAEGNVPEELKGLDYLINVEIASPSNSKITYDAVAA